MDFKLVAKALDIAIAKVAEAEYSRLSEGVSPDECAARVADALKSLYRLRYGTPPEYNEWDSLFYLTWYQPRQINFALAIAHPFRESPEPLHVIDVGCGALATQIAMAIAVAESDTSPSDIPVEVYGVDPSGPMRSIGHLLWRTLLAVARQVPELSRLKHGMQRISGRTYSSLADYYKSGHAHEGWIYPSLGCWFTAIHAVYASNIHLLRQDFATIRNTSDPAYEAITCHKIGLRYAQSLCRSDARVVPPIRERFTFEGSLYRTADWRRQLVEQLPLGPTSEKFLQRAVLWNPPQKDIAILWDRFNDEYRT